MNFAFARINSPSGKWALYGDISTPVIFMFSTKSSELKTTGMITPDNGVVFERSQVVSNFNIVFPT